MSTKAFYSNGDGSCRLEITHTDGHRQHILFENVSSMVNYCRATGLEPTVSDCYTEE